MKLNQTQLFAASGGLLLSVVLASATAHIAKVDSLGWQPNQSVPKLQQQILVAFDRHTQDYLKR